MSHDLAKRLRSYAKDQGGSCKIDDTCAEAADEIERLRAALVPFAAESLFRSPQQEFVCVKLSECEDARAALSPPEN
jgi:hypothetical protein